MSDIRAMVQTECGVLELQRFDKPEIGRDDALLRIEACGICGTDIETLGCTFPLELPAIPGHEPVGIIEEIGEDAARRWQLEVGDRVVAQSDQVCGKCDGCQQGSMCLVSPDNHGFMPISRPPAVWGGYADMMYLAPTSSPHRISHHVPIERAVLFNALSAGFAWVQAAPHLQYGQSVAVMGSGQRGLACVAVARAAGASTVLATGLSRDAHKLALARRFGADVVVDVQREDTVQAALAATDGRGFDIVVDTTPHAAEPLIDAVRIARPGGTIVAAGLKGAAGVDGFPAQELTLRFQTLIGVRSVDHRSMRNAVRMLEQSALPLEDMHTHAFSLEQAAEAVRTLEQDPTAISVSIQPGLA